MEDAGKGQALTSQDEKPDPTDGIARVETYQNARGQRIVAFVPFDGQGPRVFQGEAVLHAQTPEGVSAMPITFPIKANTIQEAFNEFEPAMKDILAEMNRPKIKIARLAPTPGNGGKRLG